MRRIKRIVIYTVLIAGAVLFMLPLLWMISTGLKPLDQTMSMPPVWLPYRFYAERDGERVEVKPRRTIDYEAVEVLVGTEGATGETKRVFVPASEISGSVWVSADKKTNQVQIVGKIPGSTKEPWCEVWPIVGATGEASAASEGEDLSEKGRPEHWFAVPTASIQKKVSPRWSNFGNAIKAMKYFPMYLKNTLVLCFLTVIGTVFSSAMAAYGFSRIEWRGRNKVFVVALATMMVPFPVVMVPLYCLFRALGWIGTLRPLWVGSFCAGAFNVFLLRQFFMTIPKDLSDAARVDGCSEFRIFWQIILPLSRPALMVVGLFQFMGTWNDFLGPLIYLTDQQDFTLALGLQFFQSQHGGTEWHYLMAASSLVALPIIALFFFTQRTFIEGISMTGLKG